IRAVLGDVRDRLISSVHCFSAHAAVLVEFVLSVLLQVFQLLLRGLTRRRYEAVSVPVRYWLVPDKRVKVPAPKLTYRVPVDPSLRSGIVQPVTVIVQPTVDVDFFAGKAIDIGAGQGAAAGNCVAEWIVPVSRNTGLAAVEHVGD